MGTVTQTFNHLNCEVRYLVVKVPTDLVVADEGDSVHLNGEETTIRARTSYGPYTYLVVDG